MQNIVEQSARPEVGRNRILPPRFTFDDAGRAYDEWGANCGPGAIAAIMGMTLDALRPYLGDFESKRYTNPTLMWEILNRLGARWRLVKPAKEWTKYGLVRIQWEGPWTEPGVPPRVAYRHTHWVGAARSESNGIGIFDINCIESGGWVAFDDWHYLIVPHLVKHHTPKGYGTYHLTHCIEITRPGEPA